MGGLVQRRAYEVALNEVKRKLGNERQLLDEFQRAFDDTETAS